MPGAQQEHRDPVVDEDDAAGNRHRRPELTPEFSETPEVVQPLPLPSRRVWIDGADVQPPVVQGAIHREIHVQDVAPGDRGMHGSHAVLGGQEQLDQLGPRLRLVGEFLDPDRRVAPEHVASHHALQLVEHVVQRRGLSAQFRVLGAQLRQEVQKGEIGSDRTPSWGLDG